MNDMMIVNLDVRGKMTARSGNCKRAINYATGRWGVDELRWPIMQKTENMGADARLADLCHTCWERGLCGCTTGRTVRAGTHFIAFAMETDHAPTSTRRM